MKKIRFIRVILFMFTLLLFSFIPNKVKANVDIEDNAIYGVNNKYWALVNFGNKYLGGDTTTIYIDPNAIADSEIKFILISEVNDYGRVETKVYERGVSSNFASNIVYRFVSSGYGNKSIVIFMLSKLSEEPGYIIEKIVVDDLEKVRKISDPSFDVLISREVDASVNTNRPYRIYVEPRFNACDFKFKHVYYDYLHTNLDGSMEMIEGEAILDSDSNECNRYYFVVNENSTYNIRIEDEFGETRPNVGEEDKYEVVVDNIIMGIFILAEYNKNPTRLNVDVRVRVYNVLKEYSGSELEYVRYTYNRVSHDISYSYGVFIFEASENGVYLIEAKNLDGEETFIEINITNIDREPPVVSVNQNIMVNTSDIEKGIFNPKSFVIAIDNMSSGDKLSININYYYLLDNGSCDLARPLDQDPLQYLYGVNRVCAMYVVRDEVLNETSILGFIESIDDTKPIVHYTSKEIILMIGDDMPSNDELVARFGLRASDNNIKDLDKLVYEIDLSKVNLTELGSYPIYASAIDSAGNESDSVELTVKVTTRILNVTVDPGQYIIYGEEVPEITYKCNGNPCLDEILPQDHHLFTGELYITSGAKYSGSYDIYSSLSINSRKYTIVLSNLGKFVIKQRMFKIVANSYSVYYNERNEPDLVWRIDTSVCSRDEYGNFIITHNGLENPDYTCTFASENDGFHGAIRELDPINLIYSGGLVREAGRNVKYLSGGAIGFYKITIGNLKVNEFISGGRSNYYLDLYGEYEASYPTILDGNPIPKICLPNESIAGSSDCRVYVDKGNARFYIYPKDVEVTILNVNKIYGESDPDTIYIMDNALGIKDDGKGNKQFEFSCRGVYPFTQSYATTSWCQNEIELFFNREEGENVGRYKIIPNYLNNNYTVYFNEDLPSGRIESAYLNVLKRDISIKVDGSNGDGKYTIYYEDRLPNVSVSITNLNSYDGLANGSYYSINDSDLRISFQDRLLYGTKPFKYVRDGVEIKVDIGGYINYIDGVGLYDILLDTLTICDGNGVSVMDNYNLDYTSGVLDVWARQIYLDVVNGLSKVYGSLDPIYTKESLNILYGENHSYFVDKSGNFVIRVINTLNNDEILDDENYVPFDKDKLVYYLERSKTRNEGGIISSDHMGEMVGTYNINQDLSKFENNTNYIINLYGNYSFTINKKDVRITPNVTTRIEFNYDNKLPIFHYSYSGIVENFDNGEVRFTDAIIGQPKPTPLGPDDTYRNNGSYRLLLGNILIVNKRPVISEIGGVYYINDNISGISSNMLNLTLNVLEIHDGKYEVFSKDYVENIKTDISASEVSVMENYNILLNNGYLGNSLLNVVSRQVYIVPNEGVGKEYGENDVAIGFMARHRNDDGTYSIEAILDSSDFVGNLIREEGEKPGRYAITYFDPNDPEKGLKPALKGIGYNFTILGIDEEVFTISKRKLVVRHAASNEDNVIQVFYGDTRLESLVNGYRIVEGNTAFNRDLYTLESLNGVEIRDPIDDMISGAINTNPTLIGDVGEYKIRGDNLRLLRVESKVDVTEYYDFSFIEATLIILPRIIYITPNPGQSKIYGEGENACEITYTYSPELINPETDRFSGCLQREAKQDLNGNLVTEDAGDYLIGLGTLYVTPNYKLVMNDVVRYTIRLRSITLTATVIGETVRKLGDTNIYSMQYGYEVEFSVDVGGMGLVNNPYLGINDRLVNRPKLNIDYVGEFIPVGIYKVLRGDLTVTNPYNYSITFVEADLYVNKRVITIHPHEFFKIYGDEDPIFTFDFEGDNVSYTGSLSRFEGENVGTYKITLGTLSFGENYNLNLMDAFFEIRARNVDVFAIAASKIYSYEDPVFEYTYEVENGFVLDTEFVGILSREPGENVGVDYKITQGNLNLNNNYLINFNEAIFRIYYDELTSIEIVNTTNNQYQIQGYESEVRMFARLNKGANPNLYDNLTWKIIKNESLDINYIRDNNNIISFTPSGSTGAYVISASIDNISATYIVYLRANLDLEIYVHLLSGNVNQKLGAESEISYYANVVSNDFDLTNLQIEWYAGGEKVCSYNVVNGNNNICRFIPSLPIGTHEVYAQVANKKSQSVYIIIRDNDAPVITLVNQGEIVYIETHTNVASKPKVYFNDPGYSAKDDIDGNITNKVKVTPFLEEYYYNVGTYVVVYSVSDSHGHIAYNYRTVIIEDSVAPTVKLVHEELANVIIEYGQEYVKPEIIAYDAYDAYHGRELVVYEESNLDISKVGEYKVIYFAVDSNGLRGQTEVNVKIQDTIKPTITLIGEDVITLEYKDQFRDPGAIFSDNYDGEFIILASKIIFNDRLGGEPVEVNSVDTTRLGSYILEYYQEDSSGNAPEITPTRTVKVTDTTPPVITLFGDNPFVIRYERSGIVYVEPGFSVIDNYDGDITHNSELVTVNEVIGDTLGEYKVLYNAVDSLGNRAKEVIRKVIVLDLVKPIIYFTETCPQHMTVEAITGGFDPRCNEPGYGYTVYDDYLPDIDIIQEWVEVTGSIDINNIGVYELYYNVKDRGGNAAITLTRYIHVVDTTPPEITLLPNDEGDIDFYVEVFTYYQEPGWVVSDIYDDYHGIEINVEVTNAININKLNTYAITYVAIDSSGNESTPVIRNVTVRDTTPPVVTLIGDAHIILERGQVRYAEYGASARDNYDGQLPSVTIKGIPKMPTGFELGEYEVEYCATDSSFNVGCATRRVSVVDTIPPVVLGVEDGHYYNLPLYIYFSPNTLTDETLTGYLNGSIITSPWYVFIEGNYHLVVADDAGNTTVIDFVLDMTPPTLYGVNDGDYVNEPVKVFSDEVLKGIYYKINNGGFTLSNEQSLTFETEGEYQVYAMDMAGNVSQAIKFTIDLTPPSYVLEGVLNGGITNTDVMLVTENDVIVSVNNTYMPTSLHFEDNGYYKVTIRDLAGNDVFIQFVINKNPSVNISGKEVTFISQNNAITKFVAKASNYPKGVGFIYAMPLLDGTFEYKGSKLFSDEEYAKLTNGEDLEYEVPSVRKDEMLVAFIVTLDELNKFATSTVEGNDTSASLYAIIILILLGGVSSVTYFFIIKRRKKVEEEEEVEEYEDNDFF